MKFSDFFINNDNKMNEKDEDKSTEIEKSPKKVNVSDILRDADVKIKVTIPTSFGTEFVLAKRYPESELKKILVGYTFEVKGSSIFVKPK